MGTLIKFDKFLGQHYFGWFENAFHALGIDAHVALNATLVSVILVIAAFFIGRKYRNSALIEPELKATTGSVLLFGIGKLHDEMSAQVPHWVNKVFWLYASFFVYILACNLWGSVPGFAPPTEAFSFTFTLGVISFLIYNFVGISTHGGGYIKQFLGPIIFIAPLIGAIELVSHLVRPLTLGLRLFGNVTGDHFVVSLFTEKIFPVLLPIPFIGLGLFISGVQAYVFYQLSLVYISGSVSDDH